MSTTYKELITDWLDKVHAAGVPMPTFVELQGLAEAQGLSEREQVLYMVGFRDGVEACTKREVKVYRKSQVVGRWPKTREGS